MLLHLQDWNLSRLLCYLIATALVKGMPSRDCQILLFWAFHMDLYLSDSWDILFHASTTICWETAIASNSFDNKEP